MKITKEQIERYLNFLNEVKSEITKNNGVFTNKHVMKISHNYSLPYGVFTTSKELGFFKETSHQHYKCMVDFFQPFHSRQLITEKRLKHREVCKKSRKKSIKAENKIVLEKKVTSKPKQTTKKQQKTFSILWGLIKFNY